MANTNAIPASESVDDARMRELTSAEELLGDPEPWEAWESKLVMYSIGIAIVGLVVLGILVNTFILT
jgi:hypothetical protein